MSEGCHKDKTQNTNRSPLIFALAILCFDFGNVFLFAELSLRSVQKSL